MNRKEDLLKQLQEHVFNVNKASLAEKQRILPMAEKPIHQLNKLKREEREHAIKMKFMAERRVQELDKISNSPFFAKSIVQYEHADIRLRKTKTLYFGKYEFSEQGIYSWVSPIATLRFENPGNTSFKLPNGKTSRVIIHEKDQYMIVDKKILFFAKELLNGSRELIYQEHFSQRKHTFALPEIVEIMEKAQDAVIRADHVGPFAITGPAGSGKTTLALHRVAYLINAPETSEHYAPENIIVFVQDPGTREYFSKLLPELGIDEVNINTFSEWAAEILGIGEYTYLQDSPSEFEKLSLLKMISNNTNVLSEIKWNSDVFQNLSRLYQNNGVKKISDEFHHQRQLKSLDRIDLTLALLIFKFKYGQLERHREYNKALRMGKIVRKKESKKINYSLILVDEFQNYMSHQLQLIQSCLNTKMHSIIYVGDMAQGIFQGTVKNWQQIGEEIPENRHISLKKIYRNTIEIIRYISSLGFPVEISDNHKSGSEVVEIVSEYMDYYSSLKSYVKNFIQDSGKQETVGILGMYEEDIELLKNEISCTTEDRVHIMTVRQALGVEFDNVLFVGIHDKLFKYEEEVEVDEEYKLESKRILKDLLYVALTRAVGRLHIYGTSKLTDLMKQF